MGHGGPGPPLKYMSTITNHDTMSLLSRIQKFLYNHRDRGHQTRQLSSVFYTVHGKHTPTLGEGFWLGNHVFTSKSRKGHYLLIISFLKDAVI